MNTTINKICGISKKDVSTLSKAKLIFKNGSFGCFEDFNSSFIKMYYNFSSKDVGCLDSMQTRGISQHICHVYGYSNSHSLCGVLTHAKSINNIELFRFNDFQKNISIFRNDEINNIKSYYNTREGYLGITLINNNCLNSDKLLKIRYTSGLDWHTHDTIFNKLLIKWHVTNIQKKIDNILTPILIQNKKIKYNIDLFDYRSMLEHMNEEYYSKNFITYNNYNIFNDKEESFKALNNFLILSETNYHTNLTKKGVLVSSIDDVRGFMGDDFINETICLLQS
jgi:hypothetical protein